MLPGEEPGSAKEPPGRGVRSPEHPARSKRGEKAAPWPQAATLPTCPSSPPPKPEAKKEVPKDELCGLMEPDVPPGQDYKPRGRQSPGKAEKPPPARSQAPRGNQALGPTGRAGGPRPAGPNLKSVLTGLQPNKSAVPDAQQEVPECVTNRPVPSLSSTQGWQSASPGSLHKPRMTAKKLGPGHAPMAGLHGFPLSNARTQGPC